MRSKPTTVVYRPLILKIGLGEGKFGQDWSLWEPMNLKMSQRRRSRYKKQNIPIFYP